MVSKSSKLFLLITLVLAVVISLTFADHDGSNHEPNGCRQNSDCGEGATCNPNNGQCTCPGPAGKEYVAVPSARPMCQKIKAIGEPCNYNDQCFFHAGELSRCNKNTCECYDTLENGRQVVRPFQGTCYVATALEVDCINDNQCRAFITPEENVSCFHNSTAHKNVCRCIEGKHCEEKSGAGTIGIFSITTFAFLGIMATQVVL